MIVLIDNYDSFVFNLYQQIGAILEDLGQTPDIAVWRHDAISVDQVLALNPSHIVLSPGPGAPQDAGICQELALRAGQIPLFGVCLGHQAICQAGGATVARARELVHGKASPCRLDQEALLFTGLPEVIEVGRYHSLAVRPGTLPQTLAATAWSDDGEIMAVAHCRRPLYGVQFHPESILTPRGEQIMRNFLTLTAPGLTSSTSLAQQRSRSKIKSGIATGPAGGVTPTPVADPTDSQPPRRTNVIKEAIQLAAARQDIGHDTALAVMDEIMSGQTSNIQMAAYLTAMTVKGETIDEITGSAVGLRRHCVRLLHEMDALEIVGTGGDHSDSFNISTTTALVVSAAGVPVAKHGNRAATSRSGAADVLEALGVDIAIPPHRSVELLREIGLCFLFAQNYHLAMKYVAPVRRELAIRTMFNLLGPLVSPAGAKMELLGVYEESLVEPLAKVLSNLGVKNAYVVYGQDGLDEISVSAPTTVCEVRDGFSRTFVLTPEDLGLPRCDKADLMGGPPDENAAITRAILAGQTGPKRDAVLMNAAAAIHIGRPELTLEQGLVKAAEVIDSGRALEQLERFVQLSRS
ncbi:MAG: anthranilate phosphoribosyltransferase [Propionibacteriaceae bacterium]|nr:anthranilate phosphoribosyltransferase [Propionibacteriaceae bacterium]